MSISKKHYVKIAAAVKPLLVDYDRPEERAGAKGVVIELAVIFAQENPLFDRRRFLEACGFRDWEI